MADERVMHVRPTFRPRRAPDLVAVDDEQDVVVYSPSSGGCAVINATASAALDLCDGTRTIGDIAEVIVSALPADPVRVVADVEAAIDQLVSLGVVCREG